MPVDRSRSRRRARALGRRLTVGLVKSQSTTADTRHGSSEHAAGLLAQVALAVPGTTVQQHLEDAGHLGGVGEQSGIARHASLESGRLIVHVALQDAFAQEGVDGRGHHLVLADAVAQGQVAGAAQSHRFVELAAQEVVERHARASLNQLLQHDEAHATIAVATVAQLGVGYFLQVVLLERAAQPQAVTHLQGMFARAHGRRQSAVEAEIRIGPQTTGYAHLVFGVGLVLVQGAFVAVVVNGFAIEQDGGRQARLVQQQLSDGDVPLVGVLQERQVVGHTVGQADATLVVKLHHGQQGGCHLGQRGQVVDVGLRHGSALSVLTLARPGAESLVVEFASVLHHHYLAARIGTLTDALAGNLVDAADEA